MKTLILSLFCLLTICQIAFSQWINISNGLPSPQNVITVTSNSSYIFIGLDGGGVFRSTNNGGNWTEISNGLYTDYVKSSLLSGTNLFVGTIGGVNLSTNNGTNWIQNGAIGDVVSFTMNGTNLFAGTTTGGVYRSTNNGGNWTAVNSGLTNLYAYALTTSGTNIYNGTISGGVFRSTNNGDNWTSVISGLTNQNIRSFTSIGTKLFAATQGGGVFLSTNNGDNWIAVNGNLTNLNTYSLISLGTNLLMGNINGGVYLSTNNGINWTSVNTGLNATTTIHCFWIENGYIFAAVYNGGVYRRPLSELITNVSIVSTVPDNYMLYNNYPNPFNPVTNIKFDIPKNSFVKITILDILGKEVTVLINENLQAGNYNIKWDASKFSSGVYFYKLESGSFMDVKRMLLIK